ncbi:PREDICTED: uncharacterized protein LOC109472036 isoform X2 [Branchiostoma belcheri]|uniref:Uncharacterized protein LOC109472036 isoform X2 n=1 Tax=Branchiostoma belcheri TaxID=7741 RepID=A0A6P4YS46_BRABE|nr:PREDICTED: uncharacterized protein LOC109472036 isoform X2 [Branchiostoma belcheri]
MKKTAVVESCRFRLLEYWLHGRTMSFSVALTVLYFIAVAGPGPVRAVEQITCTTQARNMDGESFTANCPADCVTAGGAVWGTAIYTDDSSICRAAIHDGKIPATGGVVRVNKLPGQSSYQGSTQNGITTSSYGAYGSSFAFSELEQITCTTQAQNMDGESFTAICPADCVDAAGAVWGTAIYTDDSSICRAAIHDGRIPATGGVVTGYKLPGQSSYQGSTQNGITTSSYGAYGSSFAFSELEQITCTTQAQNMDGESFTAICPADCVDAAGAVWGTAIYTDDSSICRAAIHDGRIPATGGVVTGYKLPGQSSYQGSTQNGITTSSYGAYGSSFAFSELEQITCTTQAQNMDGESFTAICPADCVDAAGAVWGTAIYTDDSSICRAAIHDGRIPATGGVVTGYKLPGQSSYQGSTQNGITTSSYGAYGSSFAFSELEQITCTTQAQNMDGESFTAICPADCVDAAGAVWGTAIYTDDSSICRAAIHDGRIPATGGVVTGYKLPGQSSYQGSTQNGITTSSYGAYGSSFAFSELDPRYRCGVPAVARAAPKDRIVGGNDAKHGAWPWQVSLRVLAHSSFHFCGGALVHQQWVVTAAHCVDDGSRPYVVLGESSRSVDDGTERTIRARRIYIHPKYGFGYDVALLKLRKRVRFTPYIRPVCLPDSTTVVQPGTVCTITGWGTTSEGGSLSDQLQEADVPIVSDADCSSSYTGLLDLDSEICAGYMAGGVDSCQGDSGGPLVWLTEGQHLLIGLTSWGEGCARPNRPGVYTRVTSVVNWIKRIIHINS